MEKNGIGIKALPTCFIFHILLRFLTPNLTPVYRQAVVPSLNVVHLISTSILEERSQMKEKVIVI